MGGTRFELVTSSVSGKRSPAELTAHVPGPRGHEPGPRVAMRIKTGSTTSHLVRRHRTGLYHRSDLRALDAVGAAVDRRTSDLAVAEPRPPEPMRIVRRARRKRESNPRTGLCRPLPKPLGHSATSRPPAGGAGLGACGATRTVRRGPAIGPRCRACPAPPSGRRDSNPRPSPWQGDALPAEPRPHVHLWGGTCADRTYWPMRDQNCSRSAPAGQFALAVSPPRVSQGSRAEIVAHGAAEESVAGRARAWRVRRADAHAPRSRWQACQACEQLS